MFASIQQVDFYAELTRYGVIPPPKKKRRTVSNTVRTDIFNAICAFDIETSRIDMPEIMGKYNSHSFMYIWQFQINDKTIIGRDWDSFRMLLGKLVEACHMHKEKAGGDLPRVIIWVHNLAYEFQYLWDLYPFANNEVFLRDSRKPIYCRMFENTLEFRCSYCLTNTSLDVFTKNMDVAHKKLSGQEFDYDKIRYPWTPLTEKELEYCVNDVRGLAEAIRTKLDRDGDSLQTMPLTSTGYVRRDCKEALKDDYLRVREMKPGYDLYKLLRRAFRGGNTHANRAYVGHIVSDVKSYDMTSCYPAVQLTKKFPMHPFKKLDDKRSCLQYCMKFIGLGYAVIGDYQFKNIRLKNKQEPTPYITLCHTKSLNAKVDNGRILFAKYSEMSLTEIDLGIILKQYAFDEIAVSNVWVSQKDYLPESYRQVIKKYYTEKTTLKGTKDSDELYTYQKSKELLNGIYGMSAQDPLRSMILFDDGECNVSDKDPAALPNKDTFPADELHLSPEEWELLYKQSGNKKEYTKKELAEMKRNAAEKALSLANFPYQWGVYTTAYSRLALQEGIDLAGERLVYVDTDSLKVIGDIDITKINKKRQALAEKMGGYALDRKGNPHYVGVYEVDGIYSRFITQGAKRYAYETVDTETGEIEIHITVAGVTKTENPSTGIPYAVEELKKLERFQIGMKWYKAGGTFSIFNDNDNFDYYEPESQQKIHFGKNIAILPACYEMGRSNDYRNLLAEIALYGEYNEERGLM